MAAETCAIVTPPPTPNGPLHLGHLSGPYVAADIAARAARAQGRRVLTMCGFDSNQNYVQAKADLEGRSPTEVVHDYGGLIRDIFTNARVAYDIFVDPWEQPDYVDSVTGLLMGALDDRPSLVDKVDIGVCKGCGCTLHHAYVSGSCPLCGAGSGGGTCEGCGVFTTALNLDDARCTRCGGAPRSETLPLPVLRLEDYRPQLVEAWSCIDMPPRVWRLIRHYLASGLPEVPLAYPTDWGIELSGQGVSGLRMDVWAEMGLGYAYAIPRGLGFDTLASQRELAVGWSDVAGVWFFCGIDNAFYYAILFPALFAALGLPSDTIAGVVVNEFYRLTGSKFSTSRSHAVWGHEFLVEEDPGMVRLYLCWDRPDRYESDFTLDAYRAFCRWAEPLIRGDGASRQPSQPGELGRIDIDRAQRALDLVGFDPALAVRCLLSAVTADPVPARRLLALVTGDAADGWRGND